jgi:hypothetical protein
MTVTVTTTTTTALSPCCCEVVSLLGHPGVLGEGGS